jgi:hypothetical protein
LLQAAAGTVPAVAAGRDPLAKPAKVSTPEPLLVVVEHGTDLFVHPGELPVDGPTGVFPYFVQFLHVLPEDRFDFLRLFAVEGQFVPEPPHHSLAGNPRLPRRPRQPLAKQDHRRCGADRQPGQQDHDAEKGGAPAVYPPDVDFGSFGFFHWIAHEIALAISMMGSAAA